MHPDPEASNPAPPAGIVGHLGIEETSEAVYDRMHDSEHLITDDRPRWTEGGRVIKFNTPENNRRKHRFGKCTIAHNQS